MSRDRRRLLAPQHGLIALVLVPVLMVRFAGAVFPGGAVASPVASPMASPIASPVIDAGQLGSIIVAFYGCPAGVEPPNAETTVCVPIVGGTGASIDSESEGTLMTLDQATDNGDGSFTWSNLPFGVYIVTDVVLPPEYEGHYVITLDRPDFADQSLVALKKGAPTARFTVFGLGGLRS